MKLTIEINLDHDIYKGWVGKGRIVENLENIVQQIRNQKNEGIAYGMFGEATAFFKIEDTLEVVKPFKPKATVFYSYIDKNLNCVREDEIKIFANEVIEDEVKEKLAWMSKTQNSNLEFKKIDFIQIV